MTTVNKDAIIKSLQELGIQKGDMVIVHSSFKSMGYVEGGAETVISAFLDVIGAEGTLVFPTLVQKDFENAYETWHMDKPSDVGYLTEYFRKREGSLRSTFSSGAKICSTQVGEPMAPKRVRSFLPRSLKDTIFTGLSFTFWIMR